MSPTERRTAFRALHSAGFFILPNPWDIGGVRRLEAMGFRAIATTSAGLAWSLGKADLELGLEPVLDHIRAMCAATDLPVNADFEAGFAIAPEHVAANVRRAVEAGAAGLSIEDQHGESLFELPLAVERIAAAREAIDAIDPEAMLIGRSEGFLLGSPDLRDTITRLVAYSEAGADCLYAPGVKDPRDIETIVEAVAPKPVNVLLISDGPGPADLKALGVRRASTGASLARAAWEGFVRVASQLRTEEKQLGLGA